jgi:glycosyltransferase involved in cell wall biosynthesis
MGGRLLSLLSVRICIVYDCLYPYTVGGAERFYRGLAERLAADGHDVTYVTLRQWDRGITGDMPGVRVVEAGPRMALYANGRRRIVPPLVFGLGVFKHLAANGRDYDLVLTGSFPYFALLAAASVRRLHGFELAVDWPEVWTRDYWREYLGRLGWIGWRVQRRCIQVRQQALCPSELHARRLREGGVGGPVTVYRGLYGGSVDDAESPFPADDVAVFAGRHIPEKRVTAIVPAIARARVSLPELRCRIFGDGPDREAVLRQIAESGLAAAVEAPGFVSRELLARSLSRALCLVLPSRREGYGLIVVEAAARGVPSIVVAGEDNAATELVEDGVNGFVVASPAPEEIADAIARVREAGPALRSSTARWYAEHAAELSLASTVALVSQLRVRGTAQRSHTATTSREP